MSSSSAWAQGFTNESHQAGPDTLMLIDTIRPLIDLHHWDDGVVQSAPDHMIQTNEKILHHEKCSINDNDDENDDVDNNDNKIEMLKMKSAAKQAVKEITDDDRQLSCSVWERLSTQHPVHKATDIANFQSTQTEDQMACKDDQEGLEYFAGIC